MKKLVILLVLVFAVTTLYAKKKVVIAYDSNSNFPYYTDKSPNQKKAGVIVEIVKMLQKKTGTIIELKRMPWKRCLYMLEKNRVDAIFQASFKTKRMKYGQYPMKGSKPDKSKRIATVSYALYKLKGSSLKWNGKKFKNLKKALGAPRGYSIVGDLKKFGASVEETTKTEQSMKKMILGRIDGVAALEKEGDDILRKNKNLRSKIVKIKKLLKVKPYYLMLSHEFVKKNPKLAKKIWKETGKLRKKHYKRIMRKY